MPDVTNEHSPKLIPEDNINQGKSSSEESHDEIRSPLLPRKKLTGVKGILGKGLLAFLVAKGGVGVVNDLASGSAEESSFATPISLNIPTPEASSDLNTSASEAPNQWDNFYDEEALKRKKEVEEKYGIKLLSVEELQKEGLISGTETWKEGLLIRKFQIDLLDELISYFPPEFYHVGDKNFGIVFRGDDFQYAGESYGGTGMVAIHTKDLYPENRTGILNLLAHEWMHQNDSQQQQSIETKINEIVGTLPFDARDRFLVTIDTDAEVNTVADMAKGNFQEPVANLAQFYISGYDNFMTSLGPIIDGKGYGEVDSHSIEEFRKIFPEYTKTKALYDLYKNEVFGGQEYDQTLIDKIKFGPNGPTDKDKVIEEIKSKYNINLNNGIFASYDNLNLLKSTLDSIPNQDHGFFNRLTINLGNENTETWLPNNQDNAINIPLDYLHLRATLPDVPISKAVKTLNHELIVGQDYLNGSTAQKAVLKILGYNVNDLEYGYFDQLDKMYGLEKLKNSEDPIDKLIFHTFNTVIPEGGYVISPRDTFANMGDLYLWGWEKFSQLGKLTDPAISLEDLKNKKFDPSTTKVSQLYEIFHNIYGKEFTSIDEQGVPH